MSKFIEGEEVRIVGEPKGSPNEFARVTMVGGEGRHGLYHVSNINMPYNGGICQWMRGDIQIEKVQMPAYKETNMTNKLLVVFDLDGTLSDVRHRMHYIMPNPPVDPVTGKKVPRRFDLFHHACVDDGVVEPVAYLYRQFVANPDVTVIVLSGRDVATLDKTKNWFAEKDLPLPDEMILKSGDQHARDVDQKRTVANQLEKRYGRKIDMVFEDRQRVVKMWKERGTFVMDVLQHPED